MPAEQIGELGVKLQWGCETALEGAWPGAAQALLSSAIGTEQGSDPAESCCLGMRQVFLFMQGWFPCLVHSTAAQTAAPLQRGDKKTSWAERWGQGLKEATITQEQPTVWGTPVKLGMGLWCDLHS